MASFAAPNVQTASQNHTQNSANNDLGSQHANGQANNSIKKIDEENLLDSSTGLSNTKSRYDIYNSFVFVVFVVSIQMIILFHLLFHNFTIRKVAKLRLRAMTSPNLKIMTSQTLHQKEVRIHTFE